MSAGVEGKWGRVGQRLPRHRSWDAGELLVTPEQEPAWGRESRAWLGPSTA